MVADKGWDTAVAGSKRQHRRQHRRQKAINAVVAEAVPLLARWIWLKICVAIAVEVRYCTRVEWQSRAVATLAVASKRNFSNKSGLVEEVAAEATS